MRERGSPAGTCHERESGPVCGPCVRRLSVGQRAPEQAVCERGPEREAVRVPRGTGLCTGAACEPASATLSAPTDHPGPMGWAVTGEKRKSGERAATATSGRLSIGPSAALS